MDQAEMRSLARPAPASSGKLLYAFVTRTADLVLGTLLLILVSPILLATAIAVYIDSGLPILYRCQRLGQHGRSITVLKFRTMKDGSHHHLQELPTVDEERRLEYSARRKLRRDPRCTRIGRFLRRSSLDEVPQLLNVLSGEMSLVGRRPYFADELRGRPEAMELLSVRPGITGLWQVNGRSDRTFEERTLLEVDYVRRRDLGLDLSIIARTIRAVVSGEGVY